MRFIYITFSTVTGAMEGKRQLQRRGIDASLRRTPEVLRQRGCGYSLRLRQTQVETAKQLLLHQGIPFERIFLELGKDQWQEVAL